MPSPPTSRVSNSDSIFDEEEGMGLKLARLNEEMMIIQDEDGARMSISRNDYEKYYNTINQIDESQHMMKYNKSVSSLSTLHTLTNSFSNIGREVDENETDGDTSSVPDMMSDDEDFISITTDSKSTTPAQELGNDPMEYRIQDLDNFAVPKTTTEDEIQHESERGDLQEAIEEMNACLGPLSHQDIRFTPLDIESIDSLEHPRGTPSWYESASNLDTGGGHGMLVSADETKVVKETHQEEKIFYMRNECNDSVFEGLTAHIPAYYGSFNKFLPIESNSNPCSTSQNSQFPEAAMSKKIFARPGLKRFNTADTHNDSIILENLKYGYKPKTISEFDLKLGRDMIDPYAPDSTPYKIDRMNQQVQSSTSSSHALRLVWANTAIKNLETGEYTQIKTDKTYGKTLNRGLDDNERMNHDDLDDAFIRLFPSPRDTIVPRGKASRFDTSSMPSEYDIPNNAVERYYQKIKDTIATQTNERNITNLLTPRTLTEELTRNEKIGKTQAESRLG
ncbi:uncharacterized protein I206_100448 [Kwoniella pini CBS 10737]|uniref:Kinase n=1 Tax=Kwoniella pini CBS 10737 TaxID=1296096 RepID=A0A1B9IDF1_9TREE|nr:uncharacterized protein I206_00881 [Kwoniella pini CBS 10737]OCF53576.1 hypothetical protein I206_00881 [Kwoniella pini CBS 10737]